MRIYIVRHGQTIWNLQERKQGHSDSPLTLRGINQAQHIADLLGRQNIDFASANIIVSPLFRTQQFAQIILETLNISTEPTLNHLLKEHAFGAWEGLTQAEVDSQFPGETEKRKDDWWNYVIPGGGESYEIISQRVKYFLNQNKDTDTMILVCHEMISKVMRGLLLDLDNDTTLALGHPQDTIYRIERGQLDEIK